MNSDLREKGYDKEEEYFYIKNQELIEKRHRELDAKRQAQTQQFQHPHWMKCPKCGSDMSEITLQGIKVNRCAACGGTYFDRGELELLMEAREPKGFFGGLKSLLK